MKRAASHTRPAHLQSVEPYDLRHSQPALYLRENIIQCPPTSIEKLLKGKIYQRGSEQIDEKNAPKNFASHL